MDATQIEAALEEALKLAERVLIKEQKHLPPTWTIWDKAGDAHVVALPIGKDSDKLGIELIVRMEILVHEAQAYGCIIEAWAAVQPKDWEPGQKIETAPRNRPDRREILLAFVNDRVKVTGKIWDIKRDWHDKVSGFEFRSDMETLGAETWMTRLFD